MASAQKLIFYPLVSIFYISFFATYFVDYCDCGESHNNLCLMSTTDFLLDASNAGGQDNQSRLHKHPFLIRNLSTAATTEDQSTTSLFAFPAS